ncbi:trafficking protein particle complex 8 [Chrysochromulina tobinii]|uniref:Trafficking protein particle complex 8 n=1 Tax=Chrysochromulina tobinii TaxID=1460289 RepID=A0A0M0JWD4_9EUKA|nr:trafficking protein particle complex 8 [Chrysochromulina tobinii]|eukprot:KOO30894.1 trafficking protein particle complex 8 [Chrysochromulina sp. CCMP291]
MEELAPLNPDEGQANPISSLVDSARAQLDGWFGPKPSASSSQMRMTSPSEIFRDATLIDDPRWDEERFNEFKAEETAWDPLKPGFYFLTRAAVLDLTAKQLQRMQEMRDSKLLVKVLIDLNDAFQGKGLIKNVLFVSHRWEDPATPDETGAQLAAIKAHLQAHPEIQYVWFDYSCMPQRSSGCLQDQDDRTPAEKAEFDLMLKSIADLYLTAKVLILLDTMYRSRFWTTMEGWCAMQQVTPQGVRPARAGESRVTVVCIHNATHKDREALLEMSTKTPAEMSKFLASPDVAVTNKKDKVTMLPIVGKTDEHVREMMSGMHSTLRNVGHLKKIRIPLGDAFHGVGIINHILFVSHRWEEPSRPDVDGVQLEAIKMYLEAHPDIKWVWFDYSSMPQSNYGIDDRTPMEKAEFQLMLSAITDLNLTAHVLILIDGSYASRFWTLFEAWCSMQTVTPEGLRPATEAERRYTIECIHNATDEYDAKGLVDKVSTKTPDEMYRILEKPDVNVTNAKDKEIMLPIIQKTNDKVIETPDVNVTNAKDKETMLPKILEIDRHVVETFQKLGT